jgi:Outer membrane protein beta-barrel domain
LPNQLNRSILHAGVLILGAFFASTQTAPAQALEAGQRGAEIAPFAQYTILSPDWGPDRDLGYTVGIDYTRFIRSIVQPSLEVRMTSANGPTVDEKSYSGGLKLQTRIHGVRPYATVLGGVGSITFNQPRGNYLGDNAVIYSAGGGALFRAGQHIDLRIDYTYQFWNLDPQTLTPVTLGIGVAYRIPFHNGRSE